MQTFQGKRLLDFAETKEAFKDNDIRALYKIETVYMPSTVTRNYLTK